MWRTEIVISFEENPSKGYSFVWRDSFSRYAGIQPLLLINFYKIMYNNYKEIAFSCRRLNLGWKLCHWRRHTSVLKKLKHVFIITLKILFLLHFSETMKSAEFLFRFKTLKNQAVLCSHTWKSGLSDDTTFYPLSDIK
jgi:hypothetical protein